MTPEERDRTMDFILRHQAESEVRMERFHAALEQERKERLHDTHGMQAMFKKLTELAELQSRRLDRQSEIAELQSDRMDRYEEFQKEFQKTTRKDQKEILERLDDILRRFGGRN